MRWSVLAPWSRSRRSIPRSRGLRGAPFPAALLLVLALATAASATVYVGPNGPAEVRGSIEVKYLQLGGPSGLLRLPLTSELPTPDGVGRFNHFQRGSIYWSPRTPAHEVHGDIRARWASLGWEGGPLGYPLTDELPLPDGVGRSGYFQGGSIYWSPATGAHAVRGAIRDRWGTLGWERGHLGYPVSDELPLPDGRGRVSHFQGGSIYWTPSTGAHEIRGSIRDAWLARGGGRGPVGYPTSEEYAVPGGRESDFEGGYLRWDAATGQVREGRGQVLAPGVTHRRVDDPAGPFSSRVLTVDPTGPATLDVALAQDRLPGFETTSSLAGRHQALAAVNGDFALPSGRPVHLYAEDGHLLQAPALVENALATPGQGVTAFLGRPAPAMSVRRVTTGQVVPLARVNGGPPAANELSLRTPEAGALEAPPSAACSAELSAPSTPTPSRDGATTSTYTVRRVACPAGSLASPATVLSAPLGGRHEPFVRGLSVGDRLQLSWSLGWPGVMDASGGNALLLEDGRPTSHVRGTDPFFSRHPRTAIGTTAAGQLLLVAVDGRQPGYSVGMTLVELAEHLRSLGAVRALLLDGGGSTTMAVRGRVTNRPSDSTGERPVPTALLVLDRADTRRPDPWRGTASADATAAVWEREAADAGSTGGWARSLRRAGARLPAELDAALP